MSRSGAGPSSAWPETTLTPLWLYDRYQPTALYASVLGADDRADTYVVDCPSSICSETDYAPQTVTQMPVASWAGQHTIDGTTTVWDCDFEDGIGNGPGVKPGLVHRHDGGGRRERDDIYKHGRLLHLPGLCRRHGYFPPA